MHLYIFDIDGTLTDTTKVDDKCFIRTFANYFDVPTSGIDFSTFENVTDWGITEEWVQRLKKRSITSSEFLGFKTAFLQDMKEEAAQDQTQFAEVQGAADFIKKLQQQEDCYLAIATGAWGDSARIKLQNGGIPYQNIPISHSDYFKSRAAITLDAIQKSKDQYGVDFQKITYFGDGAWDFKTCKALNIPFIGIDCHQNGKLKALGAERVYKNWLDLPLGIGQ